MSLSLINIVGHIRDDITFLQGSSIDLEKEEFFADDTRRRAFVRSLEVIGEAVKQIPEEQ